MASKADCSSSLTIDAYPSPPRVENSDTTEAPSKFSRGNDSTPKPDKTKKSKTRRTPVNGTSYYFNITQSHDFHLGTSVYFGVPKPETTDKFSEVKKPDKTPAIKQLLNRSDPVTKEIIFFVSNNIGRDWKALAIRLDYSSNDINQHYFNNKSEPLQEIVYQLLLDWNRNKADKAQVGILCKALWKSKEFELVQKMANEMHKQ